MYPARRNILDRNAPREAFLAECQHVVDREGINQPCILSIFIHYIRRSSLYIIGIVSATAEYPDAENLLNRFAMIVEGPSRIIGPEMVLPLVGYFGKGQSPFTGTYEHLHQINIFFQ